ncbi:MAG: DUF2232 domain-containing protein [Bdellovibrionales bacterium]
MSLFLTKLMGVFAAFPLMPTRWIVGPKLFWALNFVFGGALIALGQYEWGGVFVVLTVLTGSFSEFENRGDSLQSAGVCSILVTLIVGLGFVGISYLYFGSELFVMFKQGLDAAFVTLNSIYVERFGQELLDEKAIAALKAQTPSFILMTLIVALFFGLLGESRILKLSGEAKGKRFYRLNEFRLHDSVIWIFIASLLGSFWEFNNELVKIISTNALNVTVLLLFLQGIAVMSKFFQIFRVGTFWRVFWTVLLIVQLSIGIVLLGLIDYWLDFRLRFKRHAAEIKEGQKKHSGRK